MPQAGGPAPETDLWMRILTRPEYVRNGKLHHSALRGRALRPPREPLGWDHELSGRLRSMSVDPKVEAEELVAGPAAAGSPTRSFNGYAVAAVSELRASPIVDVRSDVVFTPLQTDRAHADFVTFGTADRDLNPILDWLQDRLRIVAAVDAHGV